MKHSRCILFGLLLILFMSGCRNKQSSLYLKDKEPIKIICTDELENSVVTQICNAILNDNGYETQIDTVQPGELMEMLQQKDADIFLGEDIAGYRQNPKKSTELINPGYIKISSGLVAPDYIFINSITQLAAHKQELKNTVYTVSLTDTTNFQMGLDAYKLGMDIKYIGQADFDTLLKKASENKEWIVCFNFYPNQIWGRYKLKFLRDPLHKFQTNERGIVSRLGFGDDYPYVSTFLSNFKLEEDIMMDFLMNTDEEFIHKWLKDHQAEIQSTYPSAWIE